MVRSTKAGSKASGQVVREGVEAVGARRRAWAQRQAAHARYVAHVEAETERTGMRSYPLPPLPPPPAPPAPPVRQPDPWPPPAQPPSVPPVPPSQLPPQPEPWPPPSGPPTIPRFQQRDGAPPAPAPVSELRPAEPAGTAGASVDRAPGVPLKVPLHVRIRSAVVLVFLMAMLGVLAAGVVLVVLFLVVELLTSL
jgi:hypothetical protein